MERDSRIEIDPSLYDAVEKVAGAEGATVEQFVNRAVLDRLRESDPAAYWAARAKRVRPDAIRTFLSRAHDATPIPGDELDQEPSRP